MIFVMRKQIAIALSGVLWMGIGLMLLTKGLKLLVAAGKGEQTTLALISIALLIGFIKGRLILAKTVKRVVARITSLSQVTFANVYDRKYIILILSMVALGISLKFFHLPPQVLGFVDVAIGSALINGALLYVRSLLSYRRAGI